MKKQLELLRELEDLDLMLKDLSSPQYKKLGFKTSKQSLDIVRYIEERRQKRTAQRIDKSHKNRPHKRAPNGADSTDDNDNECENQNIFAHPDLNC